MGIEFPVNFALVALSVIGLGSLAYYVYYKHEKEEEDSSDISLAEIRVRVPQDSIGMIIGRQGTTVKAIEDEFSCRIKFEEAAGSENRVCVIRGTEDAIKAAEHAIHSVIANQPLIETFELEIPGSACARIVGKNGHTIRSISLNSNAKISISRDVLPGGQRQILIRGTAEQIAAAKVLLNQKLIEDQEFQSHIEQSISSRSPRHTPKFLTATAAFTEPSALPEHERLQPTGGDGSLDVYASGIESPDRLWLQIRGPSTVELDRLNETMKAYYSKPECKIIHAITEVRIGQLVAAPFMLDDKYYRAQVTRVSEDSESLDLYYMDYGDSAECSKAHAFHLKPEFLKLRFQAIECILARVKPRDDEWTTEAIDLLEELLHVALWKPLTACIHSYTERPTRARREGSPVPCVDLFDTSGAEVVNVAQVLVDRGFAKWHQDEANENGPA